MKISPALTKQWKLTVKSNFPISIDLKSLFYNPKKEEKSFPSFGVVKRRQISMKKKTFVLPSRYSSHSERESGSSKTAYEIEFTFQISDFPPFSTFSFLIDFSIFVSLDFLFDFSIFLIILALSFKKVASGCIKR